MIQTLYEAFAVDIPFQYAGAKDDVDISCDAQFFTSTYKCANDEKQQILFQRYLGGLFGTSIVGCK